MSQKIITGTHAIQEAIHSQTHILAIYIDESRKAHQETKTLIRQLTSKHIHYQFVNKLSLAKLSDHAQSGIIAVCSPRQQLSLNQVIKNPSQYPCIVISDHLEDPFNFKFSNQPLQLESTLLGSSNHFSYKSAIYEEVRPLKTEGSNIVSSIYCLLPELVLKSN